MASYNPKTFTRPESLKQMDPQILRALLGRFDDFFREHGLDLQAIPPDQELPFSEIARLLATPHDAPLLASALYLIDELSSERWFDELNEEAERLGLTDASQKCSTSDLATLVWLEDPELAQRLHASTIINRKRTFVYFENENFDPQWNGPTEKEIQELETELQSWFLKNKRGRGCRVFYFHRQEEHWFLIWHGLPYRREGSIVEGQPSSVFFRPEKYDVVGLKPEDRGLLKIHALSSRDRDKYRELLAERLLPEDETFRGTERYTLDPLKTLGPKALHCADISSIAWIKLQQVEYFWDNSEGEIEVRKAKDLFAAYEKTDRSVPENAEIRSAKFSVAFRGGTRSRAVTLRPPNIVQFTRDPDSAPIEEWLRRRGFNCE